MKYSKVTVVCFSPTGGTKRAATALARELAESLGAEYEKIDITLPEAREAFHEFGADELVVFASPTYAGRVPNKIMPTFAENFKGAGTAAIALVTFGNRSFQDSLSELGALARQNGFEVVGGASMVAEHVFSSALAPGRPDAEDMAALKEFAQKLAQKLAADQKPASVTLLGNDPVGPYYTPLGTDGQPAKFLKAAPKTNDDCIDCGQCSAVCPMGSIPSDNFRTTQGVCIKCQACIKICPVNAKYFDDAAFLSHVAMLEQNYTARKENGFYL